MVTPTTTPTPRPTRTPIPRETPDPTSTVNAVLPTPSPPPPLTPAQTPLPIPDAVLVGAGDIADCASSGDEATAALLDQIPGIVFTLGDNVYNGGTAAEFADCYAPSWGRHRARTLPAMGNHDYGSPAASGYFDYFGAAAGPRGAGYYSYDTGAWHVIVLNSNCEKVGGCHPGSTQEQWLRADLAAHPRACTAAYWHHPRFSSGDHGSDAATQAFWQALYEAGAEIVLSGHDHSYERFAPQGPTGEPDAAGGIREFVVGTGGRDLYGFPSVAPNTEIRDASTFGVLVLTLGDGRYGWQFIPAAGGAFVDSGSGICH
ncbi:MAG: metallophosphoesterase [Aldersonia sp.]|nr:metallophosphoesterase [Aldersonia sp.]